MIAAVRHFIAILLLPFVVVVAMPWWLRTSGSYPDRYWQSDAAVRVGGLGGVLLFIAGLLLFTWCVALFARVGRGTLAPWDPTQRLVAVGPYRYVRNPMISAVALMLVGEAVFFGSLLLAGWSLLFIAINHIYFLLSEEPGLERRFGEAYVDYRNRVPRWIPRVGPVHGRRRP